MTKKRTLSVLITALILFVTAVIFSFTQGDFAAAEEEPLYQTVSDKNCFTLSEDGKTITDFTVPETITGFFKIVIPQGVETLEEKSFSAIKEENAMMRDYLISVEMPGVNTIRDGAFFGCTNIVEVCVKETLKSRLSSVGLGGVKSVVSEPDKQTIKIVSDGKYLTVRNGDTSSTDWVLLAYGGTETQLALPQANVLNPLCENYSIGNFAFSESALTSVVIPDCVNKIGDSAFDSSSQLKSVTLGKKVEEIGANAFTGTLIEKIQFPSTLKEIGGAAFENCAKLTDVNFAENANTVTINYNAFKGCSGLKLIELPANCKIWLYAFDECSSLMWVYAGKNTEFIFNGNAETGRECFFPANDNLTVIFPDSGSLSNALTNTLFKDKHGSASTYTVKVTFNIAGAEPVTVQKLHGKAFNFVKDEKTGFWNTETSVTDLPSQTAVSEEAAKTANYSSTVWYEEAELKNVVTLDDVNISLAAEVKDEIELYCFGTIAQPVLPAEPASWVNSSDKKYSVNKLAEVLKALGCTQEFTEEQLSALKHEVKYADEKGNSAETPAEISANGVYSVTIALDSKYGVWANPLTSSVTVNINTGSFNVVLIVFLVIGVLAIAATVSTAIIRKKVQAKNKKKQLTSQEVLEKFRAVGGETTLK